MSRQINAKLPLISNNTYLREQKETAQFQLSDNIQMVHFMSTRQLYGCMHCRWRGQELHGRAIAGQTMLSVIHGCQIM
jgi:hypothetical protein